ncbi:ribosomal RNA small subunit methyltransferase H [Gordonia araii NBRC 100433]|uniref:Ribosomal RNA small subunit methyltransferase H n=1 Tax=Gordonia araii NBRC 100433 TaxID=1073574 RepID=G7H2U8_9ACTN|nr:16S rRNA (cytosine(1402)-N(4))-methyltransferase RsmH [Gordonia araii]NNG98502.1 16S rRNA (cytosine(1402)-N(4))-methyltransferase RsmH [Gordonia araii NBRC 100433]GAB10173.1 ribosomal RNA small subunit methyltransferase H [Gordonia araii NBRC 100433]
MSSGDHGHVPVMADRIVELLAPAVTSESPTGEGAVVVDATLGAGGHAELLLRTFSELTVVGIDRDGAARSQAAERLAPFGERASVNAGRYDELARVLAGPVGLDRELTEVDGVLFDLGVSSMQLDQRNRGFAYAVDAPLDMRMNPDDPVTAADILNTYSHGDLARVLSDYGEERFAGRIASAVIAARRDEPFTTSGRLVELLYAAIPAATRRTGGHPAKRTFQALRIEVNGELDSLRAALPAALDALAVGGRVVVMSYQSLEDRIVKREFTKRTRSSSPAGLPVELPGTAPRFSLVTRGAEQASEAEVEANPRSAPARVRAIERIAPDTEGGEQ